MSQRKEILSTLIKLKSSLTTTVNGFKFNKACSICWHIAVNAPHKENNKIMRDIFSKLHYDVNFPVEKQFCSNYTECTKFHNTGNDMYNEKRIKLLNDMIKHLQ